MFVREFCMVDFLAGCTDISIYLQIIYIMRNPKDVSVSYYHFARLANIFQLDMPFDEFFHQFMDGNGEHTQDT